MNFVNKYCVYLIKYGGDKHPPFYVGSTATEKIVSGEYLGSPTSKQWKDIVKKEQKDNPHLYEVEILSTHQTRRDALAEEMVEHIARDVVKSKDYYNMSLACVNGFFGMDVTGNNNPRFGADVSVETRKAISKANKGKCVVSIDGENWFTVSSDEYHANKEKYITPKGDFNYVVVEKTRERVKNKTHHFCNPEVQKKIHEKRKGMKLSKEQRLKMSETRKSMNIPFWSASVHQISDDRWSKIDLIYNIYCENVDLSLKSWRKDVVSKITSSVNGIPTYWCGKIVVKFKNGWNPLLDNEFRSEVLNENC